MKVPERVRYLQKSLIKVIYYHSRSKYERFPGFTFRE